MSMKEKVLYGIVFAVAVIAIIALFVCYPDEIPRYIRPIGPIRPPVLPPIHPPMIPTL